MDNDATDGRFRAEPFVFVLNLPAAIAFYVDRLKFSLQIAHGEPLFFAQVAREGARLNLRHVDALPFDPVMRDAEELLSAAITVEDADGLFAEFEAANISFFRTIRTETWGARSFVVRDPDGNLILFAS